MQDKQGYVHVYTGNVKGKTSAAIGLAVKAAGAGLKTLFIQFMKEYPYSELKSLKNLSDFIKVEQFGGDKFVYEKRLPDEIEKNEIFAGLTRAAGMMESDEFDIIVLDEIFVAIYFGAIQSDELIQFIVNRNPAKELILTGRYAPDSIINLADLVTEMKEIKHYYTKGVLSRRGIDS